MKKIYTAPSLTVVSIHVEKGYAASSDGPDFAPKSMLEYPVRMSKSSANQEFSEDYSLSDKWLANSENSFWGGFVIPVPKPDFSAVCRQLAL